MSNPSINGTDNIFTRLHGDARMQPLPQHVVDVKTEEGLTEARRLIQLAIERKWINAAQLARRVGVRAGAVSELLNETWRGSAETQATLAGDLAKVVNQIIREREAKKTEVGKFVTTRLAQAIFDVVYYAVKRRKIAVFLVPAGSGKTMALEALRVDIPGAILITVKRPRATVKSFLQLWARQLGVNEVSRTEDIQDRICAAMLNTGRLVLVDEAHKLRVAALDVLRSIWDEIKAPIVMAATPVLYQTITARRIGTHGRELMDQLYSRIGIFRDLCELEDPETGDSDKLFNIPDIRKVFVRDRLRLSYDGADFLCKLANTPGAGGLRVCADLVQLVFDLWPGEEVTAALLQAALQTRLGIKEAGFRMDTAEIKRGTCIAATG